MQTNTMRTSYSVILCGLLTVTILVNSLCEQQGNVYVWGRGEFSYFTAPTLSYPEHTFSDIFRANYFFVKTPNGTLYTLTDSGMRLALYTQPDAKVVCQTLLGAFATNVVVNNQGDLYAWGYQPGDGRSDSATVPLKIQGLLQGKVVTQCAATLMSISVLTSDNKIFSWGTGTNGQLGNGQLTNELSPVAAVMTGVLSGKTIVEIKASSAACYVLANDKRVYSWGSNGLGISSGSSSSTAVAVDWSGVLNGKEVKQLEPFDDHAAAFVVTTDNQLIAWGSNKHGLVSGPTGTDQKLPVVFSTAQLGTINVRKVYAGLHNLFIETTDNRLFGAGGNAYYQLSADSESIDKTPLTEIDLSGLPSGVTIEKLVTNREAAAILGSDSKLYMWGYNRVSGRMPTIPHIPHSQKTFSNINDIKQLLIGSNHIMAVSKDNKLFLWGDNSKGQLGQGNKDSGFIPLELTGYDISQVAVYGHTNLLLTKQGSVYGWGENTNGQLGDGTKIHKWAPTQLETNGIEIGKIVQVALGSGHALALSSNNKLFAWGSNVSGQLGVRGISSSNFPVAVNMTDLQGEKVVKIYAANSYNLALTQSGKLYGWGSNSNGILLNGLTSGSTSVPTHMNTSLFDSDPIVKISAGTGHILVLTKSRKIYGWGMNSNRQLGTGTSSSRELSPVQTKVAGNPLEGKTVVQIVASNTRSYALTSEGQLYGWGTGLDMGIQSTNSQFVPILIDRSNIPSGKYVTYVSGLFDFMGVVVQDSPPTDLVCEDVVCVKEFNCFGISPDSPSVCSTRGTCIATDSCKCTEGWGGYICQRRCADCYLNY